VFGAALMAAGSAWPVAARAQRNERAVTVSNDATNPVPVWLVPPLVDGTGALRVREQGLVQVQGEVAIRGTPGFRVVNVPSVTAAQDGAWAVRTSEDPAKLFQLLLLFTLPAGTRDGSTWIDFPADVTLRQVSASCADTYFGVHVHAAAGRALPPTGTVLTSAAGGAPPEYVRLFAGEAGASLRLHPDHAEFTSWLEPTPLLLRGKRFRVLVQQEVGTHTTSCSVTLIGATD
jgi:hypothetical protein